MTSDTDELAALKHDIARQIELNSELATENEWLKAQLAEAERLLDAVLCLAPFSNNAFYMDSARAAQKFLSRNKDTPNG